MCVHNSQQKGVSGNLTIGCDTIVVAGKGEVKGEDTLFSLMYSASTSGGGAEGMIISRQNGFLVRVFRTDCYEHPNRAIVPSNYCHKKITGAFYRYDGLYLIEPDPAVDDVYIRTPGKKEEFLFQLRRCGVPHNRIVGRDYRLLCQKLGTIAN